MAIYMSADPTQTLNKLRIALFTIFLELSQFIIGLIYNKLLKIALMQANNTEHAVIIIYGLYSV